MASTLNAIASRLADSRRVTKLRLQRDRNVNVMESRVAAREISISGSQVLVALASAVCLAGLLMWTFVRFWLFAP
jgi:hypothetical protein